MKVNVGLLTSKAATRPEAPSSLLLPAASPTDDEDMEMEEEVGEALLVVLRAVTKLLLVDVVMVAALMGVKEEEAGAGAGAGADEEEAAEAAFPARDNWPKKSLKFCMTCLFVDVWWWWCCEYDCLVV